jgi:hypothetical protein
MVTTSPEEQAGGQVKRLVVKYSKMKKVASYRRVKVVGLVARLAKVAYQGKPPAF